MTPMDAQRLAPPEIRLVLPRPRSAGHRGLSPREEPDGLGSLWDHGDVDRRCIVIVHSRIEGNLERCVLHDVIPHVDGAYRTIPDASSRGVFGFSSCGFGSWNLASRNPNVFGAMAVLSADSWLDTTHKFLLYKYLNSIWPEAQTAGPSPSSPPQKTPFTRDFAHGASRHRTGDLLLAKSDTPRAGARLLKR